MKKRILAALLTAVMLMGLLPTAAFAAPEDDPIDLSGVTEFHIMNLDRIKQTVAVAQGVEPSQVTIQKIYVNGKNKRIIQGGYRDVTATGLGVNYKALSWWYVLNDGAVVSGYVTSITIHAKVNGSDIQTQVNLTNENLTRLSDAGNSYIIEINLPCPHKWDNGQVTKEATCSEEGVRTFTCEFCSETKTGTISKTAHTEQIIPAVEAKCTETGLSEGKKCSVCGEILVAQEVIPATGHSWGEWTIVKEATTTENGKKERTCSKCGTKETEEIPQLTVETEDWYFRFYVMGTETDAYSTNDAGYEGVNVGTNKLTVGEGYVLIPNMSKEFAVPVGTELPEGNDKAVREWLASLGFGEGEKKLPDLNAAVAAVNGRLEAENKQTLDAEDYELRYSHVSQETKKLDGYHVHVKLAKKHNINVEYYLGDILYTPEVGSNIPTSFPVAEGDTWDIDTKENENCFIIPETIEKDGVIYTVDLEQSKTKTGDVPEVIGTADITLKLVYVAEEHDYYFFDYGSDPNDKVKISIEDTELTARGNADNPVLIYWKDNPSRGDAVVFNVEVAAGYKPVCTNKVAGKALTPEELKSDDHPDKSELPPVSGEENTYTMKYSWWEQAVQYRYIKVTATPIEYKISYELDNGALPEGETNPKIYTIETEDFILPKPTKDGFTFTGWTLEGEGTPQETVTIQKGSTGDKTYTANWIENTTPEPNMVTVTFNANGGTPNPDAQLVAKGGKVTEPTKPTKDGYTFLGWYNGNTKWDFDTDTVTGDLTLTAYWEDQTSPVEPPYRPDPSDPSVSYNPNYGGKSQYVDYPEKGKPVYVRETFDRRFNDTLDRDGYTLIGWEYNGKVYQPGDLLVRSMGESDHITLIAQWSRDDDDDGYSGPADPDDTGVSKWLDTDDHRVFLYGYPDGSFGPDRSMTRAEVAQMFYALLRSQNVKVTTSFSDVPTDAWYTKAVNTLASLGMITGYPDGTFGPDRPITRAEFTTIAMNFAQLDTNGRNIFDDVRARDWFYSWVVGAIKYGWIGGYPDGSFRPNNTITRAEVTCIVNNMLGRSADQRYVDRHPTQVRQFTDLTDSHWGYYTIMEATNEHDYSKTKNSETWSRVR